METTVETKEKKGKYELPPLSDEEREKLISMFKINVEDYTESGLEKLLAKKLKNRPVKEVIAEFEKKMYAVPEEYLQLSQEEAFDLYIRAGRGRVGKNVSPETDRRAMLKKLYNRLNAMGYTIESARELPEVTPLKAGRRGRANKVTNELSVEGIALHEGGSFDNVVKLVQVLLENYEDLKIGYYEGKTYDMLVFLSVGGDFRFHMPVGKNFIKEFGAAKDAAA